MQREGSFWSQERTERLTHMVEVEGLSCSEIGRRLGTTKNAVIGKAYRLGLVRKSEDAGARLNWTWRDYEIQYGPRP